MKSYDFNYWDRREQMWPTLARRFYVQACGMAIEKLLANGDPRVEALGAHVDGWRAASDARATWTKIPVIDERLCRIVGEFLNELIDAEVQGRIGVPHQVAA